MNSVSRKALVEWCKGMCTAPDAISSRSDWARGFDRAMEMTVKEVESGRFIPSTESEGEAARLRDDITEAISIWECMQMDDDPADTVERVIRKLREALSSTSEPIGPSISSMGLMLPTRGLQRNH